MMEDDELRGLGSIPVASRIQINAVTLQFPSGPVFGYEWRHVVTRPLQEPEWTEWVYASRESVRKMLKTWDDFLKKNEGPTTH